MNLDRFSSRLNSISSYILYLVLFVTPLFFIPVLADIFDLPKQSFFLIASLLATICYLLQYLGSKKISFTRSIFDLPIALLPIVAIASALLSPNKFASLGADPVIFLAGAVFFFALVQKTTSEKNLLSATKVILWSGALLGLWSIIQIIYSVVSSQLVVPTVLTAYFNPAFSPTGSILSQAILLGVLLPIAIGTVSQSVKKKDLGFSLAISLVLIVFGLTISLFTLYNNRPILLPVDTGWKIATGTLGQSLTSAFVGASPAHFIDSFTLYKPIEFNNSLFWNLRFVTSSNLYFYILTTTGILGLSAFLWLAISVAKTAKKRLESGVAGSFETGLLISLIVALVIFLVLPAPMVSLFTFWVVLGLFVANLHLTGNTKFVFEKSDSTDTSSWQKPVLIIGTLAIFVGSSYFLGRLILADYHFASSLRAAAANRGSETYNQQIQALTFNPWNENYRVSYSQTNLALANALAAQPNLSDQQKQTVLALVQQSIRESRNAVSLEPRRSNDWENLSLIYRNLINFAQGADQFAIATQNQAINFDPTNPRLRLDLGGIYFSLKDFQSAAQVFSQAASLKPDFANAHYNLAQALKELKLKDQALQQLQLTSTLVCVNKNSADCQKVTAEVTALGGTQSATPSAIQGSPEPLATPAANTNLPKAATKPPAVVSSPSGELTPQ